MPATESFRINNFSYEQSKLTGESASIATPFENSLLNDHLYPLNNEFEDGIIKSLQSLEDQLDSNELHLIPFKGSNGLPFLFLLLLSFLLTLMIICFLLWFVKQIRRRRRRNRSPVKATDVERTGDVLVLGPLAPAD